jgi:hypothetical protein
LGGGFLLDAAHPVLEWLGKRTAMLGKRTTTVWEKQSEAHDETRS